MFCYSRFLVLIVITLFLCIEIINAREISQSLKEYPDGKRIPDLTPAQDRSLRKQKCYDFGKFPWGYFRCYYLGPPKVPFKYWPYNDGGYIPDPYLASYYQGNYDSIPFDTNNRQTTPSPDDY